MSDQDAEDKLICDVCVGEEFLRAEISRTGEPAECSYCGRMRETITVAVLADYIETAFEHHYQRTATDPSSFEYAMIKEGDFYWERHGEPIIEAIQEAAKIDEAPATDVQTILSDRHSDFDMHAMSEECEFDADSHYTEIGPDDAELQHEWRAFEHSLKTETRFFNRRAQVTLDAVFDGLASHETRDGRRVVVTAGPGLEISSLYRARVFQSFEQLEKALERPDVSIGPPPHDVATAGRMNARGISVFYGALDPMVALAEIRPPVGSRVVVGKFELLRPVRLLDVAALRSVLVKGSIFDSKFIRRLKQAKFLESLSHRISMPVMPGDEPSDYLITQAIADYLATQLQIDGIMYPSAQAEALAFNIVLFHAAAKVKPIEVPRDTEFMVQSYMSSEDGPEVDYRVWEEVPPPPDPSERAGDGFPEWLPPRLPMFHRESDPAAPVATLALDLNELRVHHINGVTFATTQYSVSRHRSTKGESPI